MFAAQADDQLAGVLFLVILFVVTSIWWSVMKRRQSWWWGLSRNPRDTTGERWMRSNEARADKPMPERRVTIDRRERRR